MLKLWQNSVVFEEILSEKVARKAVNKSLNEFADYAAEREIVIQKQDDYVTSVSYDEAHQRTYVAFDVYYSSIGEVDIDVVYAEAIL